jgi:hypothetical protein
MLMIAANVASAQTTALKARVILRPVTTGDISRNKLPSTTETSPGLINVAIGTGAYLEADVNAAIPAADITAVTWALTSAPSGSKAAILDNKLPANLPVYEPSERATYQVAGRAFLRPDVGGAYVVQATIATKNNGIATIAQTIIGSTYAGVSACSVCHSGGLAAAMVPAWSKTAHASIFTDAITGKTESTYGSNCWVCHTVGNNPNTTVNNGGFNSVMKQVGWTAPTSLNQANWDNMPASLKNVANIQCENCHGPAAEHARTATPFEVSVPVGSGACSTCHDAPTHHVKSSEWYSSAHAVATTDPSGAGRENCVGCHTNNGFIGRVSGAKTVDTTYGSITCQTCHEPHGQTKPETATHLIRAMAQVTLADGTKVTTAGEGALCMNCHQSRQNAAKYAASTAGSTHFGPHEGPQADMIEGVNGFTYGKTIPTSAHGFVAKDTCVSCHMQATTTTSPAFLNAGGHTFKASYTPAGQTTEVQLVGACQTCHGPQISSFDFALFDYNDDGVIEGVQTEVQHLLDELSTMLPPAGKPKTSLTIDNTWTQPQLEAAYNWLFVTNDGSKGVHNTAYTVGLLKASIANLSAASGSK